MWWMQQKDRDNKKVKDQKEEIKTTFLNINFFLTVGGKIQGEEKILCYNSNSVS